MGKKKKNVVIEEYKEAKQSTRESLERISCSLARISGTLDTIFEEAMKERSETAPEFFKEK